MDDVSLVLADRSRGASGLERMLAWSVFAHLAVLAIVALAPAGWFVEEPVDEGAVMTISLGGPVGPQNGMTAISARPVQEVRSADAKKSVEPVRPPAAREPEMVEPTKAAPKRLEAKTKVEAKDPRSRTPTKGEEVRKGTAVAETGARGQGFGLATGGGGTGATVDVGNFCCPEYLSTMVELIRRNWNRQSASGTAVYKFTVQRDGTLVDIQLEKSAGAPALDLMAQRALVITKQIPPLPAAFGEPSLTVHMQFEYQR